MRGELQLGEGKKDLRSQNFFLPEPQPSSRPLTSSLGLRATCERNEETLLSILPVSGCQCRGWLYRHAVSLPHPQPS